MAVSAVTTVIGLAVASGSAAAAPAPVELRAFVNDRCVVADEPYYRPGAAEGNAERSLGLLGLLATKLAGVFMQQAVGIAASRIQARAARQDTRYAAAKQTSLYVADLAPAPVVHLNGRLGCLTIAAGEFEPADADCRARYLPRTVAAETAALPPGEWRSDRADDSLENQLRRANVCMVQARAVYEARFEFSEDGTAWRLRNAGYRIERLLATERDDVDRSLFYTLDVRAPGRTREPELLSTAWVDLGRVKAGSRDPGTAATEPPWLRVPPLAGEARRFYDETTAVHQETAAQIEALQRAIARNELVRATLDQRRRQASGALAQSLRAEVVRTQTQGLTLQAELDARHAEYAGLGQESLELMPVSIEVGVTEIASERKALLALGAVIAGNRDLIASKVVGAASGLMVSRSLDAAAPGAVSPVSLATAAASLAPASRELEAAREAYYDALLEARFGADAGTGTGAGAGADAGTNAAGAVSGASQASVSLARARYDAARAAAGLPVISNQTDGNR